jgi:type III secretory pathway component EscT
VGGLFDEVARAFSVGEAGLGLSRGFFRILPTVIVVPAFGLRGMSPQVRASMALVLAFAVAPAASLSVMEPGGLVVTWAVDVLVGLPLALAAAVPLWAASMAGGLVDDLGGPRVDAQLAVSRDTTSPVGTLLSLLAGALFFAAGGPKAIALAVLHSSLATDVLSRTVTTLAAGATVALVVAGPILAAQVVSTASSIVLLRAPFGAARSLVPTLRSATLLAFLALSLERIAVLVALFTADATRAP